MEERKPKKKKLKPLTPKQHLFIANLVEGGMSQKDAWAKSQGRDVSTPSDAVAASYAMRRENIQEGFKDFMNRKFPQLKDTVGSVMMDIIVNPDSRPSDKLKAIQLFGDYFGWKEPTKHQHLTAKIDVSKFKLPGSEDNE